MAQHWAAAAIGSALGGVGDRHSVGRRRRKPSEAEAQRSLTHLVWVREDERGEVGRAVVARLVRRQKAHLAGGGRRHGKGVRGGPARARSRIRRARTVHHIAVETAGAEQIGAHRGGEEDSPFVNRRVCWHGAGRRNDNRGRSDWGGRGLEKNRWKSTIPRHPFEWSA